MHPTLRRTREKWTRPAGGVPRSAPGRLRALFGTTVVAVILTVAVGCDKQVAGTPTVRNTSLAGKPTTLFLLFGERSDARLLPLATVAGGRITPIVLDSAGWRSFDETYFAPGSPISVYRAGLATSGGTVRRGMWTQPDPLYTLPGCRALRPLGAIALGSDAGAGLSLELLASSAPLGSATSRPAATEADQDSARAFAGRAAQRVGLTKSLRDELELVTQAIPTGATDRPTLVVSYSEKGSGGGSNSRHLFALGDIGVEGYATTFSHSASDTAPEFRRLIDHLDVTGDGTDEIVLEGWRQKSESFLVILQFTGGRWREVARSSSAWCADAKRV